MFSLSFNKNMFLVVKNIVNKLLKANQSYFHVFYLYKGYHSLSICINGPFTKRLIRLYNYLEHCTVI